MCNISDQTFGRFFSRGKRHQFFTHLEDPGTPPKINIEPDNDGLEDDFPLPGVYSQVPAVNLPGCMPEK